VIVTNVAGLFINYLNKKIMYHNVLIKEMSFFRKEKFSRVLGISIATIVLLMLCSRINAQQRTYIIHDKLDAKEAYRLGEQSNIGLMVNAYGGSWDSVVVKMTTILPVEVDVECSPLSIAYAKFPLYKAVVKQNTGSAFINTGISDQRYYEKKITAGEFNFFETVFRCRNGSTSSKDYYENQIRVADFQFSPSAFKRIGHHEIDVVITLELYGQVTLSDVDEVALPGVDPLTGLGFLNGDVKQLRGADLSCVKNLEDEGISWNVDGVPTDPYQIMANYGANIVRLKLWVNPLYSFGSDEGQPYPYSNLASVKEEIQRAKAKGMQVLLDFHFSDTWVDPAQQIIPQSWLSEVANLDLLADKVYNYVELVMEELDVANALPQYVQIGNESNINLMLPQENACYFEEELACYNPNNEELSNIFGFPVTDAQEVLYQIQWDRQARLFNAGLSSVKDKYPSIKTVIHIAGPYDAEYWANQAFDAAAPGRSGVAVVNQENVDIIGASFYLGVDNQHQTLDTLSSIFQRIYDRWGKQTLICETSFPHSYRWSDNTSNLFGDENHGWWPDETNGSKQLDWMIQLRDKLKQTPGNIGFIYWEPFWVGSNTAKTKDHFGSGWENMTFFDYEWGVPSDENELMIDGGINAFCEGCPNLPSTGPLVRHLFDNNYEDASGNGISSQPNGNVALTNNTPAQGSHTMYQPGDGEYVDLDRNNAFIHNAFTERTVAFWVYAINTVSGRQDLFDEGGATHGMALRIDGPNVELGVQNSHQIRTVSACFDKNQWVHLAGVFDNGSLQLYINGELVAENTNVGYTSIPAHGNGAGFGATNGGNAFDQVNNTFTGALDDLSIYGRALSGGELQTLMSQANIIPDPNCASSLNLSGSGGSPQVGEIGTVSLDVPENESLKVYPNPSADGNFVVTFDLPASATVGLEVSALDGRRLVTKSLNKLVAGQHRLRIEETQGLPPGMYLLKVDFGDHVEARKLVISN
jgi:arabinogalactan endo-1,4-beta-galactosidase